MKMLAEMISRLAPVATILMGALKILGPIHSCSHVVHCYTVLALPLDSLEYLLPDSINFAMSTLLK